MLIDKKILKEWAKLKSPQDAKQLAIDNNSYTERFVRAFRTGTCNQATFILMAEFYKKKAKLVNSYKK